MPTERRFDITAFFKSYSSEILERFHPLGNPVVKLAILFRSQIGSSWRLGSTKVTVHVLIAAKWVIVFGQGHYSSISINDAISTDSAAYLLAITQMVIASIRICTTMGLSLLWVCRGTWVSISLSKSVREYDDILQWSASKTNQIKVRGQLNPLNVWSQTIEPRKLTRPTTADFSTVPTVWCPYFFAHTKLFEETNGYLHNDTMYLEISFVDPQYHLPSPLYFFLFRRDPQSFSTPCQWGELSR